MKGVPHKILDLAGHPLFLHRKTLRTGSVSPFAGPSSADLCGQPWNKKVEDQPLSLSSTILLGTTCSFFRFSKKSLYAVCNFYEFIFCEEAANGYNHLIIIV